MISKEDLLLMGFPRVRATSIANRLPVNLQARCFRAEAPYTGQMVRIHDLPAADQNYLRRLHAHLSKLGATPVIEADALHVGWADRTFPRWKKRNLFPFILSQQLFGLTVPDYDYLVAWFSPEDAMNTKRFLTDGLIEKGFLPLGYDPGGNIVFLDTQSADELEVAMIYFPEIQDVEDANIHRTHRSLIEFVQWLVIEPNGIYEIWDKHDWTGRKSK
jgi:hypothetical protein